MKKGFLVLATAVLAANVAIAQPAEGGRGPRMSGEEREKMMKEQQAKRDADLRQILVLSDAVAHKVDSVNAKYDKQQSAMMSPENRSGDRGAMRTQMENIQKAREVEVKSLLTADQSKKYDEWLKERQKEWRDRGGRGDGPRGGGRPGGNM